MPPPLLPSESALSDLQRAAEHLRFLGYTVDFDPDYEAQGGLFTARHDANFNLTGRAFRGGLLFGCVLRTTDAAKEAPYELAYYANLCNRQAVFTRFVADADHDFVGEAFYAGPYEQHRFGGFITAFDREVAQMPGQHPELLQRLLA